MQGFGKQLAFPPLTEQQGQRRQRTKSFLLSLSSLLSLRTSEDLIHYFEKISSTATVRIGAISPSLSKPIFAPSPTTEMILGRPASSAWW